MKGSATSAQIEYPVLTDAQRKLPGQSDPFVHTFVQTYGLFTLPNESQ